MHTFDKVLSDEKWNYCYCLQQHWHVHRALQGGGGGEEEERPLSHKYYQIEKPRTSVTGGRAQGGKYVKW